MLLAFGSGSWSAEPSAHPSPTRFEGEIRLFERRDQTNPPPSGSVVFTGSSSVALWRGLGADFSGFPTLNRGFGGSTWPDLNHYFDRVITKYQPRAVLVYEGDNDLALGYSVAECVAQCQRFRRQMRERLPGVPVAILAVKPSPSRRHLRLQQEELNAAILAVVADEPNWTLLNVAAPLVNASGEPRPEFFEADGLHLNPAGYARWIPVIRPWLERVAAP